MMLEEPERAALAAETGEAGRRRGRRKKDASEAESSASPGPAELPKKRGRKKKLEITAQILADQIYGLHLLLNTLIPGTAIRPEEAQVLGQSVYDVLSAHDIDLSHVMPWIGLAVAVGIVEVPVLVRIRQWAVERNMPKGEARKVVLLRGVSRAQDANADYGSGVEPAWPGAGGLAGQVGGGDGFAGAGDGGSAAGAGPAGAPGSGGDAPASPEPNRAD